MEEEFEAFAPTLEAKKHKFYSEVYGKQILEGKTQLQASEIAARETNSQAFELTDEETEGCLKRAKESKFYKQKTNGYFAALSKPVTIVKPAFEEFRLTSIKRMKDIVGEKFKENKEFEWAVEYFSDIKGGYDRTKGILIQGPVGCGKTDLMKAFAKNPMQPYSIVSCRTVARDYKEKGMNGIDKYCEPSKNGMYQLFYNHKELGWCFDDLGTESAKKNFGDELNVMTEIFLNWYDKGGFNRIHLTTNLSAQNITEIYGSRVASRMKEMFNLVIFNPTEKDKRS